MPLLLDSRREDADRPSVARPVQPVEHPFGAGGGQGRAQWFAAVLRDALGRHDRHGAASPWTLSSEIGSENSSEGAR